MRMDAVLFSLVVCGVFLFGELRARRLRRIIRALRLGNVLENRYGD